MGQVDDSHVPVLTIDEAAAVPPDAHDQLARDRYGMYWNLSIPAHLDAYERGLMEVRRWTQDRPEGRPEDLNPPKGA
jgi:hypothetical protein